jgi:hypothetical protein
LYELIEEQVANSVIKYVDDKFKTDLTDEVKDEVDSAVEFERVSANQRIPAITFAIALKRFMLRFLKVDSNKDQHPLKYYITDEGLNLWPTNISEELLDEVFPESLLVCHIYKAYTYVNSKVEEIVKKNQQIGGNRNAYRSMNDRFDSSELDDSSEVGHLTSVPFSSDFAPSSNLSAVPSLRPINNDLASSSNSSSFSAVPSLRPINNYNDDFASSSNSSNSYAGQSRAPRSHNEQQQRRRPKTRKHGNNSKYDAM